MAIVKVKKNIDAFNYTNIVYINRNKCTTYKELSKIDEDCWSYHEVDSGTTIEKSVVNNSMVAMLTKTWTTFRGTTCLDYGRKLEIHSKRSR